MSKGEGGGKAPKGAPGTGAPGKPPAKDPPVLEARGLGKRFKSGGEELVILDGLDLSVQAGSSVAILGASGSGKSTLLYILGGLDRPSGGTVLSRGEELFSMGEPELARWRMTEVGFVFQFHHLLPEFTALENVAMPMRLSGASESEALAKARPLLERVGLKDRLGHRPGLLSGGEQQRVALARAISMDPSVLLADEPTGNLDQKNARMVNELIIELVKEKSLAALVVTHNASLAGLLDLRLTLSEGKLKAA
ncbi:MAG: ABC transporter ATP-binding protein [Deltaproteobacteria bacterium]|jgi:lipoprotein-releasing system ATP-binding protein|nr:ABC transporter ATP-binding protein [Deltaproteobacteria bacterium]